MNRDRPIAVPQGTWRSGSLHVWGWDGQGPASSAWLFRGIVGEAMISYGDLTRFPLELPGGGQRLVPAVRLPPYEAAIWLSGVDTGDVSPSIAWFGALTRYALQLVGAGRITPAVRDEGPFTVARWAPVLDTAGRDAVAHAASVAPAVCRNGSGQSTDEILAALVDGVARALLHHGGWRRELGRGRSAEHQAVRAVFAGLAGPDPTVRTGSVEYHAALDVLAAELDRHRRRLHGEPVVRPRLRLHLPDDPLDPWRVVLELVDDTDAGRWCTAAEIAAGSSQALDLAGRPAHLDLLRVEAAAAVAVIAPSVPGLEHLGATGEVELDLDEADEFLERAPAVLDAAAIELIGPEHLVRARPRISGSATPAPADGRSGRFAKEALVEWVAHIDDTPFTAADLARVEASGVSLMRAGHRWVRIDPAGLRRARELLEAQVTSRHRVGPVELLRLAAGADEVADDPDGDGVEVSAHAADTDGGWVRDLLAGLGDERLVEVGEGPSFVGELRPYQRRALGWMQFLDRLGLGGCLADDMGLGKTATTLAHLAERPGPHLVVCPLSVVHNWESEANRFTPGQAVHVHHGAGRQTADPALFGFADADLVVTTYGLLGRDLDTLAAVEWSTVVLDEAQMVKNPSTRAARAVRQLRAGQKLALTGTPVENRLSELWSILDACNPGLLGSQQRFRERYATPIEQRNDPDAAARLRRLTQPFVLRRTKADRRLLPDLPDKIEQIAFATLTKEQAVLYQHVVDQLLVDAGELEGMQRRGRVLAALLRLKQICNHPAHALKDGSRLAGRSGKLNRFDELVTDLLYVDERALVFTQFREMGDLLVRHLHERFGLGVPFLHGGVAKARRDRMVAEFQDGAGAPLLVVSLKAGGTGLNLTAASQVIHYDRWWNPAVEDQATDRAWRIGQHRTVNVHKLVCQGTVEEKIGQVIDEKRAIADAVVGTGEAWLTELTADQLAELVVLGGRP